MSTNVGSMMATWGLDTSQARTETAKLKSNLANLSQTSIRGFFNMTKATEGFTKGLQSGIKMSTEMQGLMIGMMINPFTVALGGATAFIAEFKKVLKTTAAFEKEWANVTTILHVSDRRMQSLREELLGINPLLGKATELSKGMYQALSANIAAEDAVEATALAAKFATAALTSQYTAMDVGTTVVNAYGMELEDLNRVYDVLFRTVELGKLTGDQIAGSFGRVIPIAAALDISIEELSAVIAALTLGGLSADEAVTSLRGTLVQFLSPTKQAQKLATELGADLSVAAIKSKGLAGALADLAKASQGSQEATATFFENVRALVGVMALQGKQADDLDRIYKELVRSSGSLDTAFEKQTDTISAQWDRLGSLIERYEILFGMTPSGIIKDWLTDINDSLDNTLNKFREWKVALTMEDMERMLPHEFYMDAATLIISTLDIVAKLWRITGGIPNKIGADIGRQIGNQIAYEISDTIDYISGNLYVATKDLKTQVLDLPSELPDPFAGWNEGAESLVITLDKIFTNMHKPGDVPSPFEGWTESLNDVDIQLAMIDEMFRSISENAEGVGIVLTDELSHGLEKMQKELPELQIKAAGLDEFEEQKQLIKNEYDFLMDLYKGHKDAEVTVTLRAIAKKDIVEAKHAKRQEALYDSIMAKYISTTQSKIAINQYEYEQAVKNVRALYGESEEANRLIMHLQDVREDKDQEYADNRLELEEKLYNSIVDIHNSLFLNDAQKIDLWYKETKAKYMAQIEDADRLREALILLAEAREGKHGVLEDKELAKQENFIDGITNKYEDMFFTKEQLARRDYTREMAQLDALLKGHEDYFLIRTQIMEMFEQRMLESNERMVLLSERTSNAIEQTFSDMLFVTFKGDMDSFLEIWLALLDSMLRAFTDVMGQMMKEFLIGGAGGGSSPLGGLIGALVSGITGVITGNLFPTTTLVDTGLAWDTISPDQFTLTGLPGFGSGAAFSGGNVVTQPTIFPMASGAGLMGEAGPEAVMPLTRMPSGNLGVEASQASSNDNRPIVLHIHAVDAKSFQDLCSRNPNAVLGPFVRELRGGNASLRSVIRSTR